MRPVTVAVAVLGAAGLSCASARCAPRDPGPGRAPLAAPAATPAAVAPSASGLAGAQSTVPRQYLVTLAAGGGEGVVREVFGGLGIAGLQPLGRDVYLVTFGEDPGLARMEALAKQDARVRAVQPNFVYRAN